MTPSASNPILDHIDDLARQAHSQLAQPAKLAVAQAAPALSRIFEPPGGVGSLPADPNQLAGGPQPMPSQPAVPTAIGGTAPGGPEPTTPRPLATAASMGRVPRTWGPLENSQAETARLTTGDTSKPGWEQIHNPWLRTAAGIGNAALGGFFPKVAAQVPGTTLHHNMLVRNAEGAEKQQESQLDEGQKRENEQAQAAHLGAQTENLQHPPPPEPEFSTVPSEEGIGVMNRRTGGIEPGMMGGQPMHPVEKEAKEAAPHYHTDPSTGDVLATTPDGKGGYQTTSVYKGNPKVETDVVKLEVGGKSHSVIVDKKTGKTIQDLGATGEKTPNISINQGSWQLDEDAQGHPVLFNPKTGETKAAPGIQKTGTAAKATAAEEKEMGPSRGALEYAHSYLQNGVHTGAGDEALQEKFFELAKPTTGFRMTQPQMNMLAQSRSWMNGLEAHMRHATTGTWFSDEQRQQIVKTMEELAAAKERARGGGQPGGGPAAGGGPAKVNTKEEYDKLPSGSTYIDAQDGKQYKKR